jgi:N-acyl-D-aspartate/D-glutamate deacylase
MNKLSKNDVAKAVTAKMQDDHNSIQEKLHDSVWENLEVLLPNKKWNGKEAAAIDNILLSISQVTAVQTIDVTLEILAKHGLITKIPD